MTYKPIIFSAPMIAALLAGRKTQTRRVLKPQPNIMNGGLPLNNGFGSYSIEGGWKKLAYAPGDKLWVRERVQILGHWSRYFDDRKGKWRWRFHEHKSRQVKYEGGFHVPPKRTEGGDFFYTRPSIFMPRWASRISLKVTGVKVEQLGQISDQDCQQEGVLRGTDGWWGYGDPRVDDNNAAASPYEAFQMLWTSINGAGWYESPWVAVYTFDRVTP